MSDHDQERPPVTTTDAGIPAPSDEHSLTVGPDGPIVLQDHYLIQKMAQFNRERVPERVVHAKGGAFGLEHARQGEFDLLVVGRKGHSALERFLLGSTTLKLAAHAPCPLLIVPRKE